MTKQTIKNLQNEIIKAKSAIESTQEYMQNLYNKKKITYDEGQKIFDLLSQAQSKVFSALDKLL